MVFNMYAVREKAILRVIVVRQRLSQKYLENTITTIPITPRTESYHPPALGATVLLIIVDIVGVFSQGVHQLLRVGIDVTLAIIQVIHFYIQR